MEERKKKAGVEPAGANSLLRKCTLEPQRSRASLFPTVRPTSLSEGLSFQKKKKNHSDRFDVKFPKLAAIFSTNPSATVAPQTVHEATTGSQMLFVVGGLFSLTSKCNCLDTALFTVL